MRASAQKKKKVSGEAEAGSPLPQPPAVRAPAEASAPPAAPDMQEPPVVAPVLMPAVGLEVPADELAVVAGALAAGGLAQPPADEPGESAEPAPSEAITSAPTETQREDELPYGWQPVSRLTAAPPPPREDRAADAGAAKDEPWRAPDEARLLVQSPRRLFLYWRFARDPRALLREALGPAAERFSPAVRLVDATTGEEGEPAPAEGSDHWFDVLPGRLLRAEIGFHGEGLPFVRLISSNAAETPAVGVSPVEDESPEFRVAEPEFERVLEATGFAAGERREESARLDPAAGGEPDRPFSPDRFDEPSRTAEPPSPRASSDTARPTSSPRDGNQFSRTRGELF